MKDKTIFLKIQIPKDNQYIKEIRDAGLFFELIAEALNIERKNISEIKLIRK